MRDTVAIADSGPLICLSRINQLELLPRLFSNILVDTREAEAIALAQTTADLIILLDDARARKVVQRLSIKQIGTIGLLLRGKRQGIVESIKPHIDTLVENGIYIRHELIDAVLADAGEK